MTRVAFHSFKRGVVQDVCAAIIGGTQCLFPEADAVHGNPPEKTPKLANKHDALTGALKAASRAEEYAQAMSNDTTASPRMNAEVWARVSEAWSRCAALMVDPPVGLEPDVVGEVQALEDHINQAQRIIGVMFERLNVDSIVIGADDWERMHRAVITVTVTGDGNRVVRRAS